MQTYDMVQAGYGEADITPDSPAEMVGFYRPDNRSQGVRDSLRLQAAEYAGRFFDREGIEVRIETYASGRELLESDREYDLYLLDVLMPGMSGIDTAQALAEAKGRPVVIFITSSLESAVEGYRVEAAGFILKPVVEESFWATMERVVRRRLGVKKTVLPW